MNRKKVIQELQCAIVKLQERLQRQQERLENHIDYGKPVELKRGVKNEY